MAVDMSAVVTAQQLINEPKAVGISGPDGAGKGYLTEQALKSEKLLEYGIKEISMIATRPPRVNETKVCITEEEFDNLLVQGVLIGAHKNDNGFRYAYRAEDFKKLQGPAIIELNPVFQQDVAADLERNGIKFAGWVGLVGEAEYLAQNIKNRQPEISDDELNKKVAMGTRIVGTLKELEEQGKVTVFPVGWDNRETMGDEFTELVKNMIEA